MYARWFLDKVSNKVSLRVLSVVHHLPVSFGGWMTLSFEREKNHFKLNL